MEQYIRSAGRAHTKKSPDDARRRHRRLQHIGLEPLIEKVDRAHGHQLDLVVLVFARHALKAASDEEQLHQFLRIQRRRIGRNHAQDRLHKTAHRLHRLAEFIVGFGIHARVPRNFAMRFSMIVHSPQMVAIRHRSESAVERKNFQSVTRKIEVANNFRPQQRNHVRANRKLEAGKNFFRASRAAENVPALEHQYFFPCFRQIGGIGEAVVASADDNHVVFRTTRNGRHRCTHRLQTDFNWTTADPPKPRENDLSFYRETIFLSLLTRYS